MEQVKEQPVVMKKSTVPLKQLFLLSFPVFLELLLQMLIGNVDKVMVQNDTSATAINQANTILDMLMISFSVLSTASLILINQYKGANEIEKEKRVYTISFYFNLLLSFLISLIILVFAEPIFLAMQVSKEVMPEALIYIRITGGFLFLQAIMLSLGSFLRSNAFMMKCLFVSIFFNIVNISGNAISLYVLHIPGAMGVAIPSVFARVLGVIFLFLLCKKSLPISFSFKKLLAIGLPTSGESLSYSLSQIVILAFINIIGAGAPAAKTYASMIAMISYMFTSAISSGMQIMLGRYLGAKRKEEANQLVWKTTQLSMLVTLCMSILVALFSRPLFAMMTSSEEVITLCCSIMWIEVALELGRSVNIVMVRSLQTCGDVVFPTTIAVIFCWVAAVVGSYLLGVVFQYGILGVWIAMSIDELFRAAIFLQRWKKGHWRAFDLTRN